MYHGNVSNNFIILSGKIDYVYGHFKGWVTDENGEKIKFNDMKGLFEKSKLKWWCINLSLNIDYLRWGFNEKLI